MLYNFQLITFLNGLLKSFTISILLMFYLVGGVFSEVFGQKKTETKEPEPKKEAVKDSRTTQKDTFLVGAYITSLYDFSLADQAYHADFWVWYNYKNPDLKPLESVEIANAKEFEYKLADTDTIGNILWATQKCKAEVKQNWDVRNYPFDVQHLKIVLEEALDDTTIVAFKPDVENTKYDSSINLIGWQVKNFKIQNSNRTYQTTYGDPTLKGTSTYPGVTISFDMKRENSLGLFFKLFTGVYVAFLISLLALFIEPIDVDPRFGLSVGGLFAAVGNKYIVDSILPEGNSYTFVDKVHSLTFGLILAHIILSVVSLYFFKTDRVHISKKLDWAGIYCLVATYIVANTIFIISAAT